MIRLRSATLSALAPPPLTPPHKGEGKYCARSSATRANVTKMKRAAAVPQVSPPLCGEGLGVGVSFGAARSALPLVRLPAPSPRNDGEKEGGRNVDVPLSPFFTGGG